MNKFFHNEIYMARDSKDSKIETVYINQKKVFGPAPTSECIEYVMNYCDRVDSDKN